MPSLGVTSVSIATSRKQTPASSLGGAASFAGASQPLVGHPGVEFYGHWKGQLSESLCTGGVSPQFHHLQRRSLRGGLTRRRYLAAASRGSGAIILHKCFSSLLGKLPPRLYHNILLLCRNFHRQAGEKENKKKWTECERNSMQLWSFRV